MHIVISRHVLIEILARSFRMAHLAQNSAIRGSDAFDSVIAAVGVILDRIGDMTIQVHVLGQDLAVLRQLSDKGFRRDESSFPVGDRNTVDLPGFGSGHPR